MANLDKKGKLMKKLWNMSAIIVGAFFVLSSPVSNADIDRKLVSLAPVFAKCDALFDVLKVKLKGQDSAEFIHELSENAELAAIFAYTAGYRKHPNPRQLYNDVYESNFTKFKNAPKTGYDPQQDVNQCFEYKDIAKEMADLTCVGLTKDSMPCRTAFEG